MNPSALAAAPEHKWANIKPHQINMVSCTEPWFELAANLSGTSHINFNLNIVAPNHSSASCNLPLLYQPQIGQ